MMRGTSKHRGASWQRRTRGIVASVLLLALAPLAPLIWHMSNGDDGQPTAGPRAIGPSVYLPAQQRAALPHHRAYTVERQGNTFALMASDDPATHVLVATLPDGFGSETTDAIAALDLSPDQRWIAIDGMADHSDRVWVVATADGALRETPNDASGNFLHWLPDGEHFLFRPFLPTRAADTPWNPGLWIVDAASGTHVNLALPGDLPATALVDAAPSPDGARIILSVSPGLGQGSAVYLATPDGLQMQALFHADTDIGLFAWSPDGQHIAYEGIEDSTVPFRPAALWTMAPDGSAQRQITLADGGHGFAPVWSPDGARLAFVTRLNAGDSDANRLAGRLVSAVQVATVADGALTTVAAPGQTGQPRNFAPLWQADGSLVFTAMGASDGYGAAISAALLWQATPRGASFAQARLAPLTATRALSAAVLVP